MMSYMNIKRAKEEIIHAVSAYLKKDENGDYTTKLFSKEQTYKSMLKILGY